jgi:transglutaminase-like putative cysteine protease
MLSVFLLIGEVKRGNFEEGILRFEYRIINKSDKVQDVKYFLSLPRSNMRQEVIFIYPEPGYQKIIKDKYKNPIVLYLEKDMQPGEVRTHGWITHIKMFAADYIKGQHLSVLSKKDKKLYLRDKENYLINDPIITKIKNQIIKQPDSAYNKAVSVYKYLIEKVRYYRDDVWDAAPQVLKKGEGSCSEYNYAFISLLRACAVPTRYSGGFVLRTSNRTKYDKTTYEDAVFHRWTEVFTGEYGWIPFDASRGSGSIKRFTNYFNYIKRMPAGIVQTYRGDGGKDSYLNWDYVSYGKGDIKKSLRAIPVFYYISTKNKKTSIKSDLKEVEDLLGRNFSFKELLEILNNPIKREVLFLLSGRIKHSSYPLLIKALCEVKHPAAIYYSIYSQYLKIKLPYFLHFSFMVDDYLEKEITKALKKEQWSWEQFEYWFRKARKEISFDKDVGEFILHNKNINLF